MPADKHEFQGKDVADAIRKACKSLNALQEDLDIEVLNTGSTGIFGLCSQKARLRVSRKEEESASTLSAPAINADSPAVTAEPGAGKSPAKSRHKGNKRPEKIKTKPANPAVENKDSSSSEPYEINPGVVESIRADLAEVLSLMNCPAELTVSLEDNSLSIKITGDSLEDIIGPEGRTLDSLQYLFRKIISKKFSEKIIFSLDAGDFRSKRLADLEDMARKFAAEVKDTGKTKAIPSLNPSERRAIHLILQNDKDIRSRSVGEGLYKKMLIYPPGKPKRNTRKKADGQKSVTKNRENN